MKRKIKQKIKETLALPAEVIMDSPKIVLEANYNVWIENYVGIIEYSDKEVKVNTADFIVKITDIRKRFDQGFCLSDDLIHIIFLQLIAKFKRGYDACRGG